MDTPFTELECKAEEASELLKAMANAHRLEILCHLTEGEKSVGWLSRATGIGQSAVSQHLTLLRAQGLVRNRRQAQTVYYDLHRPEAREMLEALYRIFCRRTEGEGRSDQAAA